jgi:hypothetical protein
LGHMTNKLAFVLYLERIIQKTLEISKAKTLNMKQQCFF